MVEVQETIKKSSETVKEAWNKPGFETIGVESTEAGSFAGPDSTAWQAS